MSCGNPHSVDCRDVLGRVYDYLDDELENADCTEIREHLDECSPCLREFGLERVVKQLVARHCGCEPAPQELRAKVMNKIEQARAEMASADYRAVD